MSDQVYDTKDIRHVLLNAGKIKKDGMCTKCSGTGWINWNGETGDDEKPGRVDSIDRETDECETCDGVGYIW